MLFHNFTCSFFLTLEARLGANQYKERLGKEAFLWFGQCALSLKAPKDPVVTPEGFVYEREYILECPAFLSILPSDLKISNQTYC